jgi:hypothetical protein
MANVKFPGIKENMTALDTPWIYYGVRLFKLLYAPFLCWKDADNWVQGSYAGARAAHMKILYPDLVFGAIASSGKPIQFSE